RIPPGTSSSPITIASYPGEVARLIAINVQDNTDLTVPAYITFDRILLDGNGGLTGGLRVAGHVHHITFQNGEVRNAQTFLFFAAENANNITITNNLIHDALVGPNGSGSTWGTYGFYWKISYGLIESNRIYNNSGSAIQLFYGDSLTLAPVHDNIIRNNVI